ncbi:hypothetical protein ATANTOWER_000012 [Ataeniobius toweri]|uniref:Uncharacterized protein n=1 Tax=Ataeniobius toweri TaxID=208326 RepID=A0ABU7CC20_9TELE|nr:hypothetical protein [Ataeniobius toweri]
MKQTLRWTRPEQPERSSADPSSQNGLQPTRAARTVLSRPEQPERSSADPSSHNGLQPTRAARTVFSRPEQPERSSADPSSQSLLPVRCSPSMLGALPENLHSYAVWFTSRTGLGLHGPPTLSCCLQSH